jgi:hypothetical protein
MRVLKWAVLIIAISVLLFGDKKVLLHGSGDYSKALALEEFEVWQSQSPIRAQEYKKFVEFLASEGVAEVLPPWSLLIPDRQYVSLRCPIDAFVIPPRSLWPNIVPTLKLLQTDIIPSVGPIRVSSAYRPPDFNKCIGGAPKSAHLSFSAFDLVTITPKDREVLFQSLCDRWKSSAVKQKVGLGTYYSRDQPTRNIIGRFHIDTLGKRTWGFDFRATSSFCLLAD